MTSDIHTLLFGYFPYIAVAVLVVGSIMRFNADQFTWRSGSSQLLRRKQLRWGSNLFHVGVLIIFFGHLFGLLVPIEVYDFLGIGHTFKQIFAMTLGGIAGLMALVGATLLLNRRLTDPRIRRQTQWADLAILVLLYVQLVLGMLTIPFSAQHLDGAMMVVFMEWAQGILTFQDGLGQMIVPAPLVFKIHLTLGLLIFLVFPFTRLVHAISAPVWFLGRTGYQIVRSRHPKGRRGTATRTARPMS